jgi:uncharacterized membrane protein
MIQVTNETLQNASSGLSGSFNSSFGLSLVAVATVLIAVALVFIGSHVQRMQWLHEKLQAFSRTLYYTAVGFASTLVVGAIAAPLYFISQADGQTKAYALYAIGGLVGAYIVFTALGYLVDSVVLSTWREYRDMEVETDG